MKVQLRVLLILMDERMVRIHATAVMKVVNLAFQIMKEVKKVLQTMLAWANQLDRTILSVESMVLESSLVIMLAM